MRWGYTPLHCLSSDTVCFTVRDKRRRLVHTVLGGWHVPAVATDMVSLSICLASLAYVYKPVTRYGPDCSCKWRHSRPLSWPMQARCRPFTTAWGPTTAWTGRQAIPIFSVSMTRTQTLPPLPSIRFTFVIHTLLCNTGKPFVLLQHCMIKRITWTLRPPRRELNLKRTLGHSRHRYDKRLGCWSGRPRDRSGCSAPGASAQEASFKLQWRGCHGTVLFCIYGR